MTLGKFCVHCCAHASWICFDYERPAQHSSGQQLALPTIQNKLLNKLVNQLLNKLLNQLLNKLLDETTTLSVNPPAPGVGIVIVETLRFIRYIYIYMYIYMGIPQGSIFKESEECIIRGAQKGNSVSRIGSR